MLLICWHAVLLLVFRYLTSLWEARHTITEVARRTRSWKAVVGLMRGGGSDDGDGGISDDDGYELGEAASRAAEPETRSRKSNRASTLAAAPTAVPAPPPPVIKGFGGVGFMAKEAVLDAMHTPALAGLFTDRDAWCPCGPGARRGLNRLFGRPKDLLVGWWPRSA